MNQNTPNFFFFVSKFPCVYPPAKCFHFFFNHNPLPCLNDMANITCIKVNEVNLSGGARINQHEHNEFISTLLSLCTEKLPYLLVSCTDFPCDSIIMTISDCWTSWIPTMPATSYGKRCLIIKSRWEHTESNLSITWSIMTWYCWWHDNDKCRIQIKLLTHWGRDNMAAIFQMTFSNAFAWMKMYQFRLRFHWNLFLRFNLTIFQHCFR